MFFVLFPDDICLPIFFCFVSICFLWLFWCSMVEEYTILSFMGQYIVLNILIFLYCLMSNIICSIVSNGISANFGNTFCRNNAFLFLCEFVLIPCLFPLFKIISLISFLFHDTSFSNFFLFLFCVKYITLHHKIVLDRKAKSINLEPTTSIRSNIIYQLIPRVIFSLDKADHELSKQSIQWYKSDIFWFDELE